MKFLSSFDSELEKKVVQECFDEYWQDNVFVIHRDYIFFLFHVMFPSIFFIILMILWLILGAVISSFLDWEIELSILWWFFILAFIISFFMVWWKVLKLYIDYKMDFTVVTPEKIVTYNQTWFFNRGSRSIDTEKIKTITVDKNWIMKSIFNYWTIIILTEWDTENGDVTLYYVHNPDIVQKRISDLVELWEKKNALNQE